MKPQKGNRLMIALILMTLGFLLSYSFQITRSTSGDLKITDQYWERLIKLRNLVNLTESKNRVLMKELSDIQAEVFEYEQKFAEQQKNLSNLATQTETLRIYNGDVGIKGQGIEITLQDGLYDINTQNPSQYIVHDYHVLKTIHELYISGATAISINGKRIFSSSYILCEGPVITVDGTKFPAPFVISAIGNGDVMYKSVMLSGGLFDQLKSSNIEVSVNMKSEIIMSPRLQE